MAAIMAFHFLISWLVLVACDIFTDPKYIGALDVRSMYSNCDTESIWARRQPLVEIKNGYNPWPMVQSDGKVAMNYLYWSDYTPFWDDLPQVYTRSWVKEGTGHTAILYAFWVPILGSGSGTGNLRYYVIWFKNNVASWDLAFGCSCWGWDRGLNKLRWAHFDWYTCKKDGLGAGDKFRTKIVMDEYDLWPGNAKGEHSFTSYLLMWLWMPPITIAALKGVNWGGPPIIFEKGIWEPKMKEAYDDAMKFFKSIGQAS